MRSWLLLALAFNNILYGYGYANKAFVLCFDVIAYVGQRSARTS